MESVKNLIEGIQVFLKEHLKNAPFDKTETAIVRGVSDFGYIIEYNKKLYQDIRTIGGSCRINETVDIMIPQNNLNNMFILKSVEQSEIDKINNNIGTLFFRVFEKSVSSVNTENDDILKIKMSDFDIKQSWIYIIKIKEGFDGVIIGNLSPSGNYGSQFLISDRGLKHRNLENGVYGAWINK